ncbi:MAG: sigma factor-like helix-turn-helix DNA-binding protein, partial [Bradymonadaceae bacterium]
QREVFIMREVSGLKFREISEILDVPVPTIKSRMRYALEYLRGALAGWREHSFDEEEKVEIMP